MIYYIEVKKNRKFFFNLMNFGIFIFLVMRTSSLYNRYGKKYTDWNIILDIISSNSF